MKGKIILEEAFNLPRIAEQEAKLYASVNAALLLGKALADIDGRIAGMDEAGVEMQVLSLTSPGCQGLADPVEAHKMAVESNNYIADKVKTNPARFAAFAAVSMHDPKQAAEELARAVVELGCVGVMINDFQSSGPDGNTMLFYDHPSYDVFCRVQREAVEPRAALQQPIFIRIVDGEHYAPRGELRDGALERARGEVPARWRVPDGLVHRHAHLGEAVAYTSVRQRCEGDGTIRTIQLVVQPPQVERDVLSHVSKRKLHAGEPVEHAGRRNSENVD